MRIRILKNINFTPADDRRMTIGYKVGMEETIRRNWGEKLVADGFAEEIDAPPREPETKPDAPADAKPQAVSRGRRG